MNPLSNNHISIQLLVVLLPLLLLLHLADGLPAGHPHDCGTEADGQCLSLGDGPLLSQDTDMTVQTGQTVQTVRRVKRGLLQIILFLQALSRG